MSDDIMADAMELFRSGDLKGAVENLDGKLRANRDNAFFSIRMLNLQTCSTWKNKTMLCQAPRS